MRAHFVQNGPDLIIGHTSHARPSKRTEARPEARRLPKLEMREMKAPDQNEAQFVLDTLEGTHMYLPALIAAFTGLRRGAILGLGWSSIDFENRTLKALRSLEQVGKELRFKSTKSDRPRTFPIPQVLLHMQLKQRREQARNRDMFGTDYRAEDDLVICNPDGSPLVPDSFTAAYCTQVRKIGKRGYSLHTLRHHHASLLLSKGVSIAAVSKRLGHSKISTTLNMYTHAFSQNEMRAADVIDEVFQQSDTTRPAQTRQ